MSYDGIFKAVATATLIEQLAHRPPITQACTLCPTRLGVPYARYDIFDSEQTSSTLGPPTVFLLPHGPLCMSGIIPAAKQILDVEAQEQGAETVQ